MVRIQRRYSVRLTQGSCTLSTSPMRRIQFGVSAAILVGGFAAAVSTQAVGTDNEIGLVFYFLLTALCVWVSGSVKSFEFRTGPLCLRVSRSFFGIPLAKGREIPIGPDGELRVITVNLNPYGQEAGGSGFSAAKAATKSRAIAKLLVDTGEQTVFIDESTYPEQIVEMADAVRGATGMRVSM